MAADSGAGRYIHLDRFDQYFALPVGKIHRVGFYHGLGAPRTIGDRGRLDPEGGQESFLGYLHPADLLHTTLTDFLLFEELTLPADISTVALSRNVLAVSPDRFAGNDPLSDRGLYRDLELLAWDQLLKFLR